MREGDGLSRKKRLERISAPKPFDVIDNGVASLLHQAKTIAGFIRYYNMNNEPDGYFDEILPQLSRLSELYQGKKHPLFDGTTEPSQALLLTFLHQLHFITDKFNRRWDTLPYWYLNEVLGVESLPARKDKIWVSFQSGFPSGLSLEKDTGFLFGTDTGTGSIYRLQEHVNVENTELSEVLSLSYNKEKNIYPASELDCVTSVEVCKPLRGGRRGSRMFPDRSDAACTQPPGFVLSSASLLLREGQRSVSVRFESETPALTDFIEKADSLPESPFAGKTEDEIVYKILSGIFRLHISTPDGWEPIDNYHVKSGEGIHRNNLTLKFILSENFPPTTPCTGEIHGMESKHPSLKVELNGDAWMYPYSWIRNVQLKRIVIDTRVQGISDILIYNELGRIDNSKPFAPFGINTGRGSWFAVGNYEMAVKDTRSIDLNIRWDQLPEAESGLYGYYREYGAGIDNLSFRLKAGYLQDHQWQIDSQRPAMPLFATTDKSADGMPLRRGKLAKNSVLKDIDIDRMPVINTGEVSYDYDIRTRSGFVCLILEDPPMGFGEKRYRELFTDRIITKLSRKERGFSLNMPIAPRIERMTLNYHSEDYMELRSTSEDDRHELRHISPMGYKRAYPQSVLGSVPLICSMDHYAHLMIGLDRVRGGESLRLYFDFVPMRTETREYPVLSWHWGNGYDWEPIPDGVITRDTTCDFFVSGEIIFDMPENLPENFYDGNGTLWLRASAVKGREAIAALSGIYANTAELIRDRDESTAAPELRKGEIRPVNETAGLASVKIISAPRREHTAENDPHKLMRVSEYSTHRGKGVTPRDYERLVLQAFPQVGKTKCLPSVDTKGERRPGAVTMVIIPRRAKSENRKNWTPKASSGLLSEVEKYLIERCSAAISTIDAVNPVYEEVFLRCRVKFKPGYSLGGCRSELYETANDIIAPWQRKREIPIFDYRIQLAELRNVFREKEFVEKLESLSLVRIANTGDEEYRIDEYYRDEEDIVPSVPHAIFIPGEHIFNCGESDGFGIGEMSVGETFIIDCRNGGANTTG